MERNIGTKTAFISILGRPNVGKSSLLNMLIGCKAAIVSSKPQTTRNRIRGIFTHDNIQIVFLDTPGLHNPKTHLGNYMIKEAQNSLNGADAFFHVVEAGQKICDTDKKLISTFEKIKAPVILIINKIDTIKEKSRIIDQIKIYNEYYNYHAVVPVSAKTGSGKDRLIKEADKLCVFSDMFFSEDDFTDQPERVLVSEIVREKLLRLLDDEIPHGIAVSVERMRSRGNDIIDIEANIYCEKENHKGIIIGRGGEMIKKIGTFARYDIEKLMGSKANLKIWVKVKENWRNKIGMLKNLGYRDE